MRSLFYFFPLFLITAFPTFGQQPIAVWQKALGGHAEGTKLHFIRNTAGDLVVVSTISGLSQTGLDIHFMVLNTEGSILQDTTIVGGKGDDVANSIRQTLDGGYIIAGYTTSKRLGSVGKRDAWLIKTNEKGAPLWDMTFGSPEDDALTDVVEDANGDLWLSGIKNDKIWLLKTEEGGQIMFEKTYGKGESAAKALTLLPSGVALTGFDTEGGTQQLIAMAFDKTGALLWQNQLPNACGKDIIRTQKGALLIAGTQFTRRTLDDALLIKIDASTGQILQTPTFGGKGLDEDGANTLVETFDGSVFLAGYTKSYPVGSRRRQFFLVKTDSTGKESSRFHQSSAQNGFVDKALLTDDGNLLTVGSKDGKVWLSHFGQVSAPQKPQQTVELVLSNEKFIDNDGILMPNERSYYEFWIENKSTEPLYQIQIDIKRQGQIDDKLLFDKRTIQVGRLLAGERRKISIPLSMQASNDLNPDATATFQVNIKALGDIIAPKWTFNVPFGSAPRANVVVAEHRFLTDLGQNNADKKIITFKMDIENTGDLDVPLLRIRFALPPKTHPLSSERLQTTLAAKAKQTMTFDFVVDKNFTDSAVTLTCFIRDDEGEVSLNQRFSLAFSPVRKTQSEETSTIVSDKKDPSVNAAKKPNLYVIAIGVPQTDLVYSTKDAADFAHVFEQQTGKLFEKVTIYLKNKPEETTSNKLRRTLIDLQNAFLLTHTIRPEDVVILYMSSHGFTNSDKSYFKIAASDYDDLYRGLTSIDFQKDVLEILAPVLCKKILFLDACHSGSLNSTNPLTLTGTKAPPNSPDLQAAVARILSAEANWRCLVSSQADEFSYEDATWQNSAFTKALTDAFKNTPLSKDTKKQGADTDNDHILTFNEIVEYTRIRVPQLVKAVKKATQTPMMTTPQYADDLPIFVLE